MNRREHSDLDRHITGNYGEDQLTEQTSKSPYHGTTQDRINFAASYIAAGRRTTRTFDTCFEMGDGEQVYNGLRQRAAKNPQGKLALNLYRYINKPKGEA